MNKNLEHLIITYLHEKTKQISLFYRIISFGRIKKNPTFILEEVVGQHFLDEGFSRDEIDKCLILSDKLIIYHGGYIGNKRKWEGLSPTGYSLNKQMCGISI